ncbi:DCC1-like thiol-disulfide oxidoreductase family protein [bacterium]|nr:DCC1-like thiol-disulfide oxidoreductase family protein [bacterium]
MSQNHIIIFDGVCNFCNTSINFIMKHDRQNLFSFTANQAEKGQEILQKFQLPQKEVGTIYLFEEGKVYRESTAALRIAKQLTFPFNLLYGFIVLPSFIRDGVYRWIAQNRYKWFGKRDVCRMPTPEDRSRFV